jgi:hypothetical protein
LHRILFKKCNNGSTQNPAANYYFGFLQSYSGGRNYDLQSDSHNFKLLSPRPDFCLPNCCHHNTSSRGDDSINVNNLEINYN